MVPAGNLATWLLDGARAAGAGPRIAVREGSRAWTYDQLATEVAACGAALRALGLAPGDRVLILMRDTLEAATAILGVIHAGAVAVPVSELATPDDVRAYVLHAGAVFAIVDGEHAATVDAVRSETPGLREFVCVGGALAGGHDFAEIVATAKAGKRLAAIERAATDDALVLYSAGSGPGELRAVPHSSQTLHEVVQSFGVQLLALTAADRVLSVARLSTAYGLGGGLLLPLALQAETLLFPAQPKSEAFLDAMRAFQPTVLFATPSLYSQLVHDVEEHKHDRGAPPAGAAPGGRAAGVDKPLAGLREAVAGAEGMPERLIPRIRSVLGTEVIVGYGLTEIFQFALAGRSSDAGSRPGVCGKPLAGVEVRLVDDEGALVGADEIGTLELRSKSLFAGYHGEPEGTSFRGDRWFTTRDRFMVDHDGAYHHCGRVDDLFKVGGKWVSPVEVERALTAHEAVWECAVIGAPDEDGLIKPLAFVTVNVGHAGGTDLESELKEYIKHTLAPYKYPRWIEFVDALPRGPGGKLLRYKLKPRQRRRRAETGHEIAEK